MPAEPIAVERLLVGTAATLNVTFLDQLGEPADAVGAVTVDVARGDGSAVFSGQAALNPAGTGTYTAALTAAQNDRLDWLSATWKDGGVTRMTTVHEVVGGFYFSVAQARAFDPAITTELAADAKVQAVRTEVERECELITGCAFVPRYRRARLSGSLKFTLVLPNVAVQRIRSVRVYSDATNYVAFDAAQVAALNDSDSLEWGEIGRRDLGVWTAGLDNLVVEYEHGRERPPEDLRHAALTRLRSRLYMENSGIPDRATSFTISEMGVFSLATPGRAGFETGIPDVDAVYQRYSRRVPGLA